MDESDEIKTILGIIMSHQYNLKVVFKSSG